MALSIFYLQAEAAKQASTDFYGINSNNALPLVEVKSTQDSQQLTSGILKDLGRALYKEMGIEYSEVLLPKKRIPQSLLSGAVDIVCHTNEVWLQDTSREVLWSHDLYKSTNRIVYTGSKPLHKIQDLYGHRVGSALNFVYRDLDPHFKKMDIIREDGPNNESNLQKLLKGRIDYIVLSNMEYNYYKKLHPTLNAANFEMDSLMTKCALSKKSEHISLVRLNKAIDSIKKNGILDKILKSYQ